MLKYERLVSVFFLLSIIGCWILVAQSAPVNGASRANRTMGRSGANKFDQPTAKANVRAKLTTTTTTSTTTTTTSAAGLDDSYDYDEDDKDASPQADDADYKENEQQYDDDDYADAKSAQSPQTADESEDFIRIKPSPTDDLDPVVQEEETLVRTTSSPTTTSTSPTTTSTTTSTTTTTTTTTTTIRTSASSSPTTPAKHQSSKQAKGNNNTSHEENGDYIFDDEDYYNLAINHFKKADSTNTTLPSTTLDTSTTKTTTTTTTTKSTTTTTTSTTSSTTARVLSTYKKSFKTAVEPSTRKPAFKDYDQNEDDALYEDEYPDTAVRTPKKQNQPTKAKPASAQVNVISKKLNSNQMLIDPTVSATATTSQVKVVSNRPSSGNNRTSEKESDLESVPDEYYDYNNEADESQQPGRSNNRTNGEKGAKPDDEYDYSNDANDYYDDYGDDYTNEETDPDEDYYETDVKDKSTDAQQPQNEQNYEYYDELGGGGGVDSNATKSPSVVTTLNLTSLVASSATVSSASSKTSQTTTTASSTTTQMTTTTTPPPPPPTTTTTGTIMTGSSSSSTSTTIKSTDLNYDTYTDMEIEIDDSVTDPNGGDYEDYHGDDVDLLRSSSRKPQLDGKSKDPSGNSTSTFITTLTWRDLIKSPALLAGIFGGLLVGIITALLLLVFIIYRMKRRKKDESTYIINGTLKSANLHYQPNGAGAIGGNIRSYRTHHAAQHVTLLSSSSISPNANVTAGSSASSSSSSSSSSASSASSATTGLLNGTTTTSTRILKYTKTNSLRKTASVLSSDSAASSPNHDGSFNYAYIKAPTKEFYA